MRYTVQHSDWHDKLYGWQVLSNGRLIDTYEDKAMAIQYAEFMNDRIETKANELGEMRANRLCAWCSDKLSVTDDAVCGYHYLED